MSSRRGVGSAAALVIASMVGSGVFTTSGLALADLGDPRLVLAAWGVGGVLAALGALCYGALAQRFPRSGGEYTFLSETLHPAAGLAAGYVSLLAGFAAPLAAAALGFEAYLSEVVSLPLPSRVFASVAIMATGLSHALSSRAASRLHDGAVALKVLLIVGFVGLGALALPEGAPARLVGHGEGGLLAFAVTVTWVSFSYSGWNAAVYVAGEVEQPRRNVPRALLLGTGVVTALYLALNAVFLASAPAASLAGRPDIASAAAFALGGPGLQRALTALVALALLTSVSASLIAGPRVIMQMAREGALPPLLDPCARPLPATLLLVGLALAVVWVAGLSAVLGYVGFTLNLSATAAVLGLLRQRWREGARAVPIPGHVFVPVLFVLAHTALAVLVAAREPQVALAGLGTALLLPLASYRLAQRRCPRYPKPT